MSGGKAGTSDVRYHGDAAERLRAARTALVRELTSIASAVDGSATRCPYRDARDRCAFEGGCRNQGRPTDGLTNPASRPSRRAGQRAATDASPAARRCSGAPLTP